MSILIKGFSKKDFDELVQYARYGANNCMIGENTEVIEIPPHGSLIDMDDFLQECSELESYRTAMKLCEVIEAEPCNDLAKPNNDPTVIEAEGRE